MSTETQTDLLKSSNVAKVSWLAHRGMLQAPALVAACTHVNADCQGGQGNLTKHGLTSAAAMPIRITHSSEVTSQLLPVTQNTMADINGPQAMDRISVLNR